MMESSSGTAQKSSAAPCLASAKLIISRPMQRAAHKTYSTGENRGNGEGILCSLCLLLFKSGPDDSLAGADARPGGAHRSCVGPFDLPWQPTPDPLAPHRPWEAEWYASQPLFPT